jgi:hypothetical protein
MKLQNMVSNISSGSIFIFYFNVDGAICTLIVKENGRLAQARASLAEQPLSSIRHDGLPARLDADWEVESLRPCASSPPFLGYIVMPILCVEWLCTQERWNPIVIIIFGAAARYRRATAGSSHDDVHPDKSTLHKRWFPPHRLCGGPFVHIAPYGPWQVSRKCSACCQSFRAFRGHALFE